MSANVRSVKTTRGQKEGTNTAQAPTTTGAKRRAGGTNSTVAKPRKKSKKDASTEGQGQVLTVEDLAKMQLSPEVQQLLALAASQNVPNQGLAPPAPGGQPADETAGGGVEPQRPHNRQPINHAGEVGMNNAGQQPAIDPALMNLRPMPANNGLGNREDEGEPPEEALTRNNAGTAENGDGPARNAVVEDLRAELAEAREEIQRQRAAAEQREAQPPKETAPIPRPKGQPGGKDFNLQDKMGFGDGSDRSKRKYNAIRGVIRRICIQLDVDWTEPLWSNVDIKTKIDIFELARKRCPKLDRYMNDWATDLIAKQWCTNQRKKAYASGALPVPERYHYLKANAAKRSNASRASRVKTVDPEVRRRAREELRERYENGELGSDEEEEGEVSDGDEQDA